MKIAGSVVLITGANRGIGLAFVHAFLKAGVKKVYAASRKGDDPGIDGVVPVVLDVTDPAQIKRVAADLGDVNVLVNNAGILVPGGALADDVEAVLEQHMQVNVLGPVRMTRIFAPVLKLNGGGAVVNVHSLLTWLTVDGSAAYSASKAAIWAFTNGIRIELARQGTQVIGVHVGFVETDMTAAIDVPKMPASGVADSVLAALESGTVEVLVDESTRQLKASLSSDAPGYLHPPTLG